MSHLNPKSFFFTTKNSFEIVSNNNTTYKLYDWTGALLRSGALVKQLNSIALNDLPQGCLLLKIEKDGKEAEYLRFIHF